MGAEPFFFLARQLIYRGLQLWDYLEERRRRARPADAGAIRRLGGPERTT